MCIRDRINTEIIFRDIFVFIIRFSFISKLFFSLKYYKQFSYNCQYFEQIFLPFLMFSVINNVLFFFGDYSSKWFSTEKNLISTFFAPPLPQKKDKARKGVDRKALRRKAPKKMQRARPKSTKMKNTPAERQARFPNKFFKMCIRDSHGFPSFWSLPIVFVFRLRIFLF